MTTQHNLHFLLALGNTKMVVFKKDGRLDIYANSADKQTVDSSRLADALNSR